MNKTLEVYQVGAGGTGGYLIPILSKVFDRASYISNLPINYFIIDKDVVEEKNIERQNFVNSDIGKPKALVFGERYNVIPRIKYLKTKYDWLFEMMETSNFFALYNKMNNNNAVDIDSLEYCVVNMHKLYDIFIDPLNYENKVEALKKMLSKIQYGMTINQLLRDVLIISCVDKVSARLQIAEFLNDLCILKRHFFTEYKPISLQHDTNKDVQYYLTMILFLAMTQNIWFIDSGNGSKTGQVYSYHIPSIITKTNDEPLENIFSYKEIYEGVIDEDDRVSCADIVEQTSLMNMKAASNLLAMIDELLEKDNISIKAKYFTNYISTVDWKKGNKNEN